MTRRVMGLSDFVALMQGGLKDPLGYQEMSHFRPHIAFEHLLLGTFRSHMKKFKQRFLKLAKSLWLDTKISYSIEGRKEFQRIPKQIKECH